MTAHEVLAQLLMEGGDERLLAFREMQGLALVIVEKRVVIDAAAASGSGRWPLDWRG